MKERTPNEQTATLPFSNPVDAPQLGTADGESLSGRHEHQASYEQRTAGLLLRKIRERKKKGRPHLPPSGMLAREEAHCTLTPAIRPIREGSNLVAISKEVTDQLMEMFRKNQRAPIPWTVSIFVSFDNQPHWQDVVHVMADDQLGAHAIAMCRVAERIPLHDYDTLSVVCERVSLSAQMPPDVTM